MTRPANQRRIMATSERLVERTLQHRIVPSDETKRAREDAHRAMTEALAAMPLEDLAALIHDATRHEQRFTHPTDALPAGHVVQLMGGRYAKILMHGFDSEGSFGYLCTAQFGSGDMLFTYHHRDTRSYAFAPMEPGR